VRKKRLNVVLSPDHAERIAAFAALKSRSKASVVAAAIAAYISPDGSDRREEVIAHRLTHLTRHLERLERDQTILIETLALYIRHAFAVTPAVLPEHQDAARAQSRLRFQEFIEQLARALQRGDTLVQKLQEEVTPAQKLSQRRTDTNAQVSS
jgi:predicted RNA-binding protein